MSEVTGWDALLGDSADGLSPCAYVDGRVRYSEGKPLYDPSTEQPVAMVGWSGEAEVDLAVSAATAAWAQWTAVSLRDRAGSLRAVAAALRDSSETLATLIVEETGKRRAEAEGEVSFSAQYFEWFAEAAVMPHESYLTTPQRRFLTHRVPSGVVAAVTPWNFPLSIPARKLAAALAAGCPVVLKPSELTPRSGLLLTALVQQFVPRGLVGAIAGDGASLTSALIDHSAVSAITFTGSTRVGALVAQRAGRSLTRTVLELGGRAPFIVTADADVETAVESLLVAKFRNNGASCIAANNVFIHESLSDQVTAALRERIRSMRVGSPRESSTELGPVISSSEQARIQALVEQAEQSGAAITRSPKPDTGWFVEATLVELGESSPEIWSEEVFGPVCVVRSFRDTAEVLEEVNGWNTGLAGYVVSRRAEEALDLAARLRVGIVGINNGAPNTPEVPFGGFGLAGLGREGGLDGLKEFTELQTISIAR